MPLSRHRRGSPRTQWRLRSLLRSSRSSSGITSRSTRKTSQTRPSCNDTAIAPSRETITTWPFLEPRCTRRWISNLGTGLRTSHANAKILSGRHFLTLCILESETTQSSSLTGWRNALSPMQGNTRGTRVSSLLRARPDRPIRGKVSIRRVDT